jgi:DNA-binding SARP family transcriptional activator
VEFRVLGPVEVVHATSPVQFGRRQQRLVLGILALEVNHVVTVDRLIDLLWNDHPPRQARAVLHSRVSEIRGCLGGVGDPDTEVRTVDNGYVLRTPPERVDAFVFRNAVTGWRRLPTLMAARTSLRAALGLWRGPVLGGGLTGSVHVSLCQGLESARLTAIEDLFDIELGLGKHHQVVAEIIEASAVHPTRERLVAQMMRALYRSGRGSEAVTAYDRWRKWLAEELGTDPGNDVRQLYLAILRNDPELDPGSRPPVEITAERDGSREAGPSVPAAGPAEIPARHNLPRAISDFTGRTEVVDRLLVMVATDDVVLIDGMAGAGKTTLAIRIAHLVADRFPDGHLYIDLHGHSEQDPVEPAAGAGPPATPARPARGPHS